MFHFFHCQGLHAGSTRKRKQLTEEWEEEEQAEEGSHPKTARAPLKVLRTGRAGSDSTVVLCAYTA